MKFESYLGSSVVVNANAVPVVFDLLATGVVVVMDRFINTFKQNKTNKQTCQFDNKYKETGARGEADIL